MIIEQEKINLAKEKLGDMNALLMAEALNIDNFDEKNMKCNCPYHSEDTPSFIYNRKKYQFHCFGCGATVDLVDVYMQKGNTFINACKNLFEAADMEYSFGEADVKTRATYKYPHDEDGTTDGIADYFSRRGISKDTLEYLNISSDAYNNAVFKFYDTNDVLTMVKYRPSKTVEKGSPKTWCQKDSDTAPLLFNMNRINTSQPLLLCEGEIDCASAIEAGYYNTVSVPLGAGNFHWIEENWEWLEQFDTIIIAADNDAPGEKMKNECIYRLGSWRTKFIDYPKEYVKKDENGGVVKRIKTKDMNDILQTYGPGYVMNMIVNAKETPVKSVVDFTDVEDIDVSTIDGILTGIKQFDREMMRLFYGTLNIVTGTNGSGKSSFLAQLVCSSIEQYKDVWMYSGEMPNYMSKNWIDSIFAGARNVDRHENNTGSIYYTINNMAKKKISEFYKKHFYLYKDEAGNKVEDLKESMEECVRKFGCKLFILDNMSSINLECNDNNKWQKQVDLINWLISFGKKYHVVVILVIHPKKIETYRRLTKFDVQGLGTAVDLAHRLISLYRVTRKEKEDTRNPIEYDVILDVLKDRMRGREGLEVGLFYDQASRRFYSDIEEYNKQYSWDDNEYNGYIMPPEKNTNNPFYKEDN